MKKVNFAVGLGEVLFDVIEGQARLGGAPCNFAWHCHELGARAFAVSAVGGDALGEQALSVLTPLGLAEGIERNSHPTGQVNVSLDENGDASYDFLKDTAYDHLPFTDKQREISRLASIMCFGTLCQRHDTSRTAIRGFLQNASGDDCLRVFDVNLRQGFYSKEIIVQSLLRCEILKLNEEELEIVPELLGLSRDPEKLYAGLYENYGIRGLVLTYGPRGSEIFFNDDHSSIKAPHVKVADTVGAGDSFTAALSLGLYEGMGLERAHRIASEVSAFVCTRRGAMVQLPDEFRQEFA